MTPNRSSEILGGLTSVLAGGLALALIVLGLRTATGTLLGLGLLAAIVAVVAGFTLMHAAMRRLAELEQQEAERLRQRAGALFTGEAASAMRERNLRQFERWLAPGFTLALGLLELLLGLWLGSRIPQFNFPSNAGLGLVALLAVAALPCYLAGSYLAGLAYGAAQPVLRALAGELLLLAVLGGLGAAVMIIERSAMIGSDLIYTRVLQAFFFLRAAERLLSVLLELYRPRAPGAPGQATLVYESRFGGLFAQPRGLLGGLAESLNYQFGVRLDEAGLRRTLWLGLPAVLLFHAVVLALASCFVFINPGEAAVREHFGRPWPAANPVLGPGMHLQWPWPIDRVYRHPVGRLQVLTLDSGPLTQEQADAMKYARGWRDDPTKPGALFLAGNRLPEGRDAAGEITQRGGSYSLLASDAVIHYRITELRDWVYQHRDAAAVLRALARRELAQTFAGQDLFDLLAADRAGVGEALRQRLQTRATELRLGVEIVFVGLQRLQPPAQVAPSFQEVIGAGEDRQRMVLQARDEASKTESGALTAGYLRRSEAIGYRERLTQVSAADLANFHLLRELFHRHRDLYRTRAYLSTLETALRDKQKIILATKAAQQTFIIDLKPKGTELFELAPRP